MRFIKYATIQEIASEVAGSIAAYANQKKDALLCLAAGHTSLPVFERMVRLQEEGKADFTRCYFFGMDEWTGYGRGDDGSMVDFMWTHLFTPLCIQEDHVRFFDGRANVAAEVERANAYLQERAGLDFILLGLGMNGHIGLNEPGVLFDQRCHYAVLDEITLSVARKYFISRSALSGGVTIGLRDIADAKQVILLATGEGKKEIVSRFLKADVTPDIPATFLKTLPHCTVIVDEAAAGGSKRVDGNKAETEILKSTDDK